MRFSKLATAVGAAVVATSVFAVAPLALAAPGTANQPATSNSPATSDQAASASRPAGVVYNPVSWSKVRTVPGLTTLDKGTNSVINQVSCTSKGNCVAVGRYAAAQGNMRAFVVEEQNSAWGPAHPLPGVTAVGGSASSEADFVSCRAGGNCTVAGRVNGSPTAATRVFVADEKNGTWGSAQLLTPPSDYDSFQSVHPESLSCGAA